MLLQYIVLHAYYRGDDIVFGEKEYSKPPSPVKAVLEGRQLGWGPDGASGYVWTFSYFSRMRYIQLDSCLPTPLHFPIPNNYFLLAFTTNAYL